MQKESEFYSKILICIDTCNDKHITDNHFMMILLLRIEIICR